MARVQNGELLRRANGAYEVPLTIDKSMPFQQSLKGLEICVPVLDIFEPSVEVFKAHILAFEARIGELSPGSFNLISL